MTKTKIDIGNSKMREICPQKSNGHKKRKVGANFSRPKVNSYATLLRPRTSNMKLMKSRRLDKSCRLRCERMSGPAACHSRTLPLGEPIKRLQHPTVLQARATAAGHGLCWPSGSQQQCRWPTSSAALHHQRRSHAKFIFFVSYWNLSHKQRKLLTANKRQATLKKRILFVFSLMLIIF